MEENKQQQSSQFNNSSIIDQNQKHQSSQFNNLAIPISIVIAGLIIAASIIITNQGNINKKNIDITGNKLGKNDLISEPIINDDFNNKNIIQEFNITKDNHIRGNFDAPITLVEFSDFECPFCARHYPTLNKILSDYKGKVRLVYKHFPLGFHPNAQKAAEASECADEQGKFWEYHDKLFENQANGLSIDKFKQWAKDLGLDTNKFNDCLDSGKYAQKVQADYQEGAQKGVDGTPATFINGKLITGALPYEFFKKEIDSILNKK
jgi:protein-disulfide isomerase